MGNLCCSDSLYPSEQRLWHICKRGDKKDLESYLRTGDRIINQGLEWQDLEKGRTPLLIACEIGSLECVTLLINNGANTTAKDRINASSCLHYAVKYGHLNIVRYLINLPHFYLFQMDLKGCTAFDIARKLCDNTDNRNSPNASLCLQALEEKLTVYGDWIYASIDNPVSYTFGLDFLTTWGKRYCLVLRMGSIDHLELAFYSTKETETRRAMPNEVLFYDVRNGAIETTNGKLFQHRDHVFRIRCITTHQQHFTRQISIGTPLTDIKLAAVDGENYRKWIDFFNNKARNIVFDTPGYREIRTISLTSSPRINITQNEEEARFLQEQSDYEFAQQLARELHALDINQNGVQTNISHNNRSVIQDQRQNSFTNIASRLRLNSLSPSNTKNEKNKNTPRKKLYQQNISSEAIDIESNHDCVICFDQPQTAVCVPCGHNALCMTCATNLQKRNDICPICRSKIREVVRIYRV